MGAAHQHSTITHSFYRSDYDAVFDRRPAPSPDSCSLSLSPTRSTDHTRLTQTSSTNEPALPAPSNMLATKFALLALPVGIMAQLSGLRGTIPGSLHQCENTSMFFFDSSNDRPITVLFLPSSEVPDSIRSGTTTLEEAAQYSPLQVIEGITTPDAQAYDFELQIAEGEAFEVFAFLEDGSGKALSLTRTVTTPLPTATACLAGVQTTVSGIAANATPASSSSSTSSSSSSSAAVRTTSTRSTTSARSTSTTMATVTNTPSDAANAASLSSIPASATGGNTGAAFESAQVGTVASVLIAGAVGIAGLAFAL